MRVHERLAASAVAVALLVGGAAAVADIPAASAAPVTGSATQCSYGSYPAKTQVLTAATSPLVVYRRDYARPTSADNLTDTAVMTASVRLDGEVSTALADTVLSRASARVGFVLASVRSRTSSTPPREIADDVTSANATTASFVAFKGYVKASGTWQQSYCHQLSGNVGQVGWATGTWASFGGPSNGVVQCGEGTTNIDSVAKAAYTAGC